MDYASSINLFNNLFLGFIIAAIVFFIAAVLIFFLLKIPNVYREYTGKNAQLAIAEMTEENMATGTLVSSRVGEDGRRHRRAAGSTGALKKGTNKLTGNVKKTPPPVVQPIVQSPPQPVVDGDAMTASVYSRDSQENAFSYNQDAPSTLTTDMLTAGLPVEQPVNSGSEETAVLAAHASPPVQEPAPVASAETVPLDTNQSAPVKRNNNFKVLRTICFVHSDEVIQ